MARDDATSTVPMASTRATRRSCDRRTRRATDKSAPLVPPKSSMKVPLLKNQQGEHPNTTTSLCNHNPNKHS